MSFPHKLIHKFAKIVWATSFYEDCKYDSYMGEFGILLLWGYRIMLVVIVGSAVFSAFFGNLLPLASLFGIVLCSSLLIKFLNSSFVSNFMTNYMDKWEEKEKEKEKILKQKLLELHKDDPPKKVTKIF